MANICADALLLFCPLTMMKYATAHAAMKSNAVSIRFVFLCMFLSPLFPFLRVSYNAMVELVKIRWGKCKFKMSSSYGVLTRPFIGYN